MGNLLLKAFRAKLKTIVDRAEVDSLTITELTARSKNGTLNIGQVAYVVDRMTKIRSHSPDASSQVWP